MAELAARDIVFVTGSSERAGSAGRRSSLPRKDFDPGLARAGTRVPMLVAAVVHQLIQALVGRRHGTAGFAVLLQQQADSAGLALVVMGRDVTAR